VLHGPGQEAVALDADLLAVAVEPLRDDAHATRDLADPSRHRQAALEPGLVAVGADISGLASW